MSTPAPDSYAAHWRKIEAQLSPEQRSRTKCRCSRERPYRTCPRDFRETYIRLGWETIAEHYRTNWRVIARWIDETGRQELRAARSAHVKRHGNVLLHPVK
ncbi:MAG: hypothetical protein KAF42_01715 [Sphingopyxis terrae]|nr:hypothetical protein [Sphingopyxis terrae]